MINFSIIEYLKDGNPTQIKAYEILTENEILRHLAAFHPILAGTIPIHINIENSDLDIICYWKNKTQFTEKLKMLFESQSDFIITETPINGHKSIIANFKINDFEIEIFGQNIPTKNQNGYKHMIKEYEILQSKDEVFRLEIIRLKQNGYKTEPAFVHLLGLKGNPYVELLNYKI